MQLKDIGLTKKQVNQFIKEGIFVKVPDYFYKYFRINDNFLNSIGQNYFWLSRPSEFNDPFDARLLVDTENTVEEIDAHIADLYGGSELLDSARKIYTGLKTKDPELLSNFVNAQNITFNESLGICCFTPKHDNLLMWAHYADNHKGVCVKFDFSSDEGISQMLQPVEYSKDYPRLNFIELHKTRGYPLLFLTKSTDWSYEDEWRIVRTEHPVEGEENETGETNYGKLNFIKSAIVEVFFGCKATDIDIERTIDAFIKSGYSSVVFYKGEMVDFKFNLNFLEIRRI